MATELWAGNQGILCVYVSKARDLPNLNKLDKQNVMLRLRIAHMTRESDILLRAGQNPIFNYLEKYEITPAVKPTMQVEVYCDRKKKPPILIGRCEIDLLNGIRADPREGYCSWYELKRERNEFAGTIFIELTFNPSLLGPQKEKRREDREELDASMVRRPVPPLPGDSYNSASEEKLDPNRSYLHASVMRDVTPRVTINREQSPPQNFSRSMPSTRNYSDDFESSINTNKTSASQETDITTTSDTRFHFANLKKLKERINVFKNANNSLNNNHPSDTPVDIEALQKAIGVTTLDDYETDSDDDRERHNGDRRTSHVNRTGIQPPLPPLPSERPEHQLHPVNMPRLPAIPRSDERRASPARRGLSAPKLPPLPASAHAGSRSPSPERRPPPRSK